MEKPATNLNPGQLGSLQRAMELLANVSSGGEKLNVMCAHTDLTLEKMRDFGARYGSGLRDIADQAFKYLQAAWTDKDYPPL